MFFEVTHFMHSIYIQTQNHLNLLIWTICSNPHRSFSIVKSRSHSNQAFLYTCLFLLSKLTEHVRDFLPRKSSGSGSSDTDKFIIRSTGLVREGELITIRLVYCGAPWQTRTAETIMKNSEVQLLWSYFSFEQVP